MPILYRDRLFGATGTLLSLAIGLVVGLVGWMVQSPLWLGLIVLSPAIACVVMLSTLTIEVSKERASWYFTLGILKRSVLLSDMSDFKAIETTPFGWGYRFEGNRKAWVVSGSSFVVIRTKEGEILTVNVRDAEAVVAAMRQATSEMQGQ